MRALPARSSKDQAGAIEHFPGPDPDRHGDIAPRAFIVPYWLYDCSDL
jgi:hypothetical protein